jgi:DNA-directed RNA polymerase specialized sigma24 family protein
MVLKTRGWRGEPQAAEELVQEAMIRLLMRRAVFDPALSTNPLAFLSALLTRVCKELERRQRRDRERMAKTWAKTPERVEEDPAETVWQKEVREFKVLRVREVVAMLTDKEQELLRRAYGCDAHPRAKNRPGAERNRLSRLVSRMRSQLQDLN